MEWMAWLVEEGEEELDLVGGGGEEKAVDMMLYFWEG